MLPGREAGCWLLAAGLSLLVRTTAGDSETRLLLLTNTVPPLHVPADFVVSHPSYRGTSLLGRLAALLLDQRRIKAPESGATFALQVHERSGYWGSFCCCCCCCRRHCCLLALHLPTCLLDCLLNCSTAVLHPPRMPHPGPTQERRMEDVRPQVLAEIQGHHEGGRLVKGGLESDRCAWPRWRAAAAAAASGEQRSHGRLYACRPARRSLLRPPPLAAACTLTHTHTSPTLAPGWTTCFVCSSAGRGGCAGWTSSWPPPPRCPTQRCPGLVGGAGQVGGGRAGVHAQYRRHVLAAVHPASPPRWQAQNPSACWPPPTDPPVQGQP